MHDEVRALGRALHDLWSMRRDHRRLLGDGPASVSQMTLLNLIGEGTPRVSELAARSDVDPSVVSRQVAHLDSLGLVSRTADPEDGRSHLVQLTAQGADALQAWRDHAVQRWAEALGGWSADEMRALATKIDRLRTDLIEAGLYRGPTTTHERPHEEHSTA